MSEPVRRALELLADGRTLCNCGRAYQQDDGSCRYGCSANQAYAAEEIARAFVVRPRGIEIVPPDGERISFHASDSPVERVGWTEDGLIWVVTDPFEEWHLDRASFSWTRVQ